MSQKIDIGHLARLSRLELTEEEKEKYAKQMGGVLEYVEKLEESSSFTSGESNATPEEVPSLEVSIINGVQDVMREDEVGESLPREEALKNAPISKNGYIAVRAVFGSDTDE